MRAALIEIRDKLEAWAEFHESRRYRLRDSETEQDARIAANYRVLINKADKALKQG